MTFSDPVAAVQAEVDALTAAGVNKIIVLSHSGYSVDQKVAVGTTGVDVIVGGHSNTLLSNTNERAEGPYPTMVGATAIVSAYAYGKFLGELNVAFNDAGEIVTAVGEPLVMDAAVVADEATLARIAELAAPLEEIRQKVVAESTAEIDGSRDNCRTKECAMGNLVAEAMLDRVKAQGVSIAIANGGGLRSSIDAGPVTMGEVLTVLPFQNTLSTFQAKGSTIIEALENGVSQVEEGAGRFPQVAGLQFAFDPKAPAGARVSDVMVLVGGDAWAPPSPNLPARQPPSPRRPSSFRSGRRCRRSRMRAARSMTAAVTGSTAPWASGSSRCSTTRRPASKSNASKTKAFCA